jgi:hypothetical protein
MIHILGTVYRVWEQKVTKAREFMILYLSLLTILFEDSAIKIVSLFHGIFIVHRYLLLF